MSKHNKERKQKAGSQLTIPEDFTGYLSQLDQPDDAANPFEAMIDVLLGRSVPDRKTALCKTAAMLQSFLMPFSVIESNESTIMEILKKSLRGDDQEKILAAKIASFLAISKPTLARSINTELKSFFEAIFSQDINSEVGPDIIKTWGTLLFIASDDSPDAIPVFDKFFKWLLDTENSNLQIAILETFSFCYSYLSGNSAVVDTIALKYVPDIETILLTNDSPFVQKTAAQTIAVMLGIEKYDVITEGGDNLIQDSFSLNEIVSKLEDNLEIRIAGISREEQKAIRRAIKECLKVINSDSDDSVFCPVEVRDVEKNHLEVDTWRQVVQIRWFTDILRGGVFNHIFMNPFFAQVFDIVDLKRNQTAAAKRESKFKHTESDKLRTKERRKTQRTAAVPESD